MTPKLADTKSNTECFQDPDLDVAKFLALSWWIWVVEFKYVTEYQRKHGKYPDDSQKMLLHDKVFSMLPLDMFGVKCGPVGQKWVYYDTRMPWTSSQEFNDLMLPYIQKYVIDCGGGNGGGGGGGGNGEADSAKKMWWVWLILGLLLLAGIAIYFKSRKNIVDFEEE